MLPSLKNETTTISMIKSEIDNKVVQNRTVLHFLRWMRRLRANSNDH